VEITRKPSPTSDSNIAYENSYSFEDVFVKTGRDLVLVALSTGQVNLAEALLEKLATELDIDRSVRKGGELGESGSGSWGGEGLTELTRSSSFLSNNRG